MFEKCTTGVLFFIGLVFVIWFPLIILSSGLPGSTSNPVTNLQMSVGVQGWEPFYQINQEFTAVYNSSAFRVLRANNGFITPDDASNTQILQFSNT